MQNLRKCRSAASVFCLTSSGIQCKVENHHHPTILVWNLMSLRKPIIIPPRVHCQKTDKDSVLDLFTFCFLSRFVRRPTNKLSHKFVPLTVNTLRMCKRRTIRKKRDKQYENLRISFVLPFQRYYNNKMIRSISLSGNHEKYIVNCFLLKRQCPRTGL